MSVRIEDGGEPSVRTQTGETRMLVTVGKVVPSDHDWVPIRIRAGLLLFCSAVWPYSFLDIFKTVAGNHKAQVKDPHVCWKAVFLGRHVREFQAVPSAERRWLYLVLTDWWRSYKWCRGLELPTSLKLVCLAREFVEVRGPSLAEVRKTFAVCLFPIVALWYSYRFWL